MTVADASGKQNKEPRHNNVFIKPTKGKEESGACLVFEMAFSFFTYVNVGLL